MEDEIDQQLEKWKNNWQAYRQYPSTRKEIQSFLDEISRERSELQRQYEKKSIDFDELIIELRTLSRKARDFQAAVDDDQEVDIEGRMRRI